MRFWRTGGWIEGAGREMEGTGREMEGTGRKMEGQEQGKGHNRKEHRRDRETGQD